MSSTRRPKRELEQASTLEEVAEFCRKRYREAIISSGRFPSDAIAYVNQRAAYAAVYRIITGRHPDTEGEGKAGS